MVALSAAAYFTREIELNPEEDWDREDVEAHSEQVAKLIFKAVKTYRQVLAEQQRSGFMILMHRDPLIEGEIQRSDGLNPRALLMVGRYYILCGEVEKGFG